MKRLTIRDAWESFYRPYIEPTAAEGTLATYEYTVRAWERWGPSSAPVDTLRSQHFVEFKGALLAEGRAPATINRILREIRAVLRFLTSERLLRCMPQIRSVREPERRKPRPSMEQLGRLYEVMACDPMNWPLGPRAYRVAWWQSYLVWGVVGALRDSELRLVRHEHCTRDGIELIAPKTERFSFVAGIPCVMRHIERMQRFESEGNPFLLHAPAAKRQFYQAVRAIGLAAGVNWTPHALKRSGIDAWGDVCADCMEIVGHRYHGSTAIKDYLDRKRFLMKRMHLLPVPPQFG